MFLPLTCLHRNIQSFQLLFHLLTHFFNLFLTFAAAILHINIYIKLFDATSVSVLSFRCVRAWCDVFSDFCKCNLKKNLSHESELSVNVCSVKALEAFSREENTEFFLTFHKFIVKILHICRFNLKKLVSALKNLHSCLNRDNALSSISRNTVCVCICVHLLLHAVLWWLHLTVQRSGAQLIIYRDTTTRRCAHFPHFVCLFVSQFSTLLLLSLCSHQGEIQRLDRVPRSGPDRLQDGTGQPAGGGECVHVEGIRFRCFGFFLLKYECWQKGKDRT